MKDRNYIIMLYDCYSELFDEKKRLYFEEYYFNNLSLGEISTNLGVSRNAIHKVISNMEEKLLFYEEKLGLYHINKVICDIIEIEENEDVRNMLKGLL